MIFQFVTTSYGTTDPAQPGIPLTATFDLTGVGETGSFFISRPGGGGPGATASPSLLSAVIQGQDALSVTSFARPLGQVAVSLSYVDGVVTSSSIVFQGVNDEVRVSGTGPTASGFLGSDNPRCNTGVSTQRCFVSGFFTQVPEPMSVALLGTAFMGLAVTRRRS